MTVLLTDRGCDAIESGREVIGYARALREIGDWLVKQAGNLDQDTLMATLHEVNRRKAENWKRMAEDRHPVTAGEAAARVVARLNPEG